MAITIMLFGHLTGALWDGAPICIPSGTRLYRSAPKISVYSNVSSMARLDSTDTNKTGVYFGTYPFVSLGIAIETHSNLELGVFELIRDIIVGYGKYSFRSFDPERFWDTHTGALIPYVKLEKNENVSHFDMGAFPLDEHGQQLVDASTRERIRKANGGELFLTDLRNHLDAVRLIRQYRIPDWKALRREIANLNGTHASLVSLKPYIHAGVVVPIHGTRRTRRR